MPARSSVCLPLRLSPPEPASLSLDHRNSSKFPQGPGSPEGSAAVLAREGRILDYYLKVCPVPESVVAFTPESSRWFANAQPPGKGGRHVNYYARSVSSRY